MAFPFFKTVRRGRQKILAFVVGIPSLTLVGLFIAIGLYNAPPWILLVGFFAGLLLSAIGAFRLFIRWRIAAYGNEENIRQLHFLASLSGMVLPAAIEPFAQALSSRDELERWKDLRARAEQSTRSLFPALPPEETAIGHSPQQLLWLLGIVVLGAVLVRWLIPAAVTFLYEIILAGLILTFVFRLSRIFRKTSPAVVLNKEGISFPETNRVYPWREVADEEVRKIPMGKSSIHKLVFRHRTGTFSQSIENWDCTPGELRYLLMMYRNTNEKGQLPGTAR